MIADSNYIILQYLQMLDTLKIRCESLNIMCTQTEYHALTTCLFKNSLNVGMSLKTLRKGLAHLNYTRFSPSGTVAGTAAGIRRNAMTAAKRPAIWMAKPTPKG